VLVAEQDLAFLAHVDARIVGITAGRLDATGGEAAR
jgi:hypothetical protein